MSWVTAPTERMNRIQEQINQQEKSIKKLEELVKAQIIEQNRLLTLIQDLARRVPFA